MKEYRNTYSTVEPQSIEFTETKVFVANNVHQINTIDERDREVTYYVYDLIEYNTQEYFQEIVYKQNELQEELQAAKILLGVE